MTSESTLSLSSHQELSPLAGDASTSVLTRFVPTATSKQLFRMFRDPRVLEKEERADLVRELRSAVELAPAVAEVRVLFGMALCVDLQAQEALEQLRIAVEQAPDCFIARLKYGELLMRLRICGKAAEETHQAAKLAGSAAQSEMARRQATTIRTMMREGVERGGFKGLFPSWMTPKRRVRRSESVTALANSR
ncbi:hypothetical protein [Occallatibacter riparius]|uniref:Tetratricopeptide repeat protein n=1 Tax=Occallatibacter riparius TaxID=1002689 RepID=A0A9J7BYY1_9BACT|nr:hypothetical protein [Occallatibacter riparius]UWZ86853.1 hypothetical protein MOP44_13095 [Occallatibacter riparius]